MSENVTTIGEYAFAWCPTLASISIPDSVTSIGIWAFYNCASLTSISIPDGVTTISEYAFALCPFLTSIIISRNVTNVEDNAFYACRSLTDVYYGGSEADWANMSIGEENEYLTGATIHYNYSTETAEVSFPAIDAYENAAEAKVIIDEDGEVTINLIITDESALSASNVTVYVVSYSGDMVEAVKELSKTITASGATFTGSISGDYKIFIWDEHMQPITEKIE